MELLYYSDLYWLYVLIAGFSTGVICAMGGSGGLIITPFLIASGMPIHFAIGTAKLSSLGMWVTTLIKFKKANKVQWEHIPKLISIACLGAIIGSVLTLSLDKQAIYPIVGIILICIAPIGLLRKDFGLTTTKPSRHKNTVGYILYCCVMIFGGFFGAGAGMLAIITLISCMGFTAFQAHATHIIPWIALTIISAGIFAWYGYINYIIAISLFTGMTSGGWVGAHLALKGNDKLIKTFTFGFAFFIGCKLLYESL